MTFILRKTIPFIISFTLVAHLSCKDDTNMLPAYLEADSFTLETTSVQGTNSHRINDIWVYLNDDIQGVYELPCKFPVLAEGKHRVHIKAGILMNGISATRIFYPFFNTIEMNIDFNRGTTHTLNLNTTYSPDVVFKWMENFEDGGISLESTLKSEVDIIKSSEAGDIFEGNFSAKAVLDSGKSIFECQTIDAFQLPKYGAPVFLEMNYKTNSKVHVGVFAYSSAQLIQRAVLVLNETDTWRKIYINLTNAVSENINATEYRVFFGMLKNDDENIQATCYFDNIKLIHF